VAHAFPDEVEGLGVAVPVVARQTMKKGGGPQSASPSCRSHGQQIPFAKMFNCFDLSGSATGTFFLSISYFLA
jgi:hypothetical protein